MAARARHWLFKKRTWAGVAVAIGVVLGINFPQFWKGLGGGGPNLIGFGPSGVNAPDQGEAARTKHDVAPVSLIAESETHVAGTEDRSSVVKVIIAERSLRLGTDDGDRPIEVAEVVELVKRAKGDADGIRLRIYRTPSSRASAESRLQDALTAAAIPENAILWLPTAND